MKKYTEEELSQMDLDRLHEIIRAMAAKFSCKPEEICPKRATLDLAISSILEAQEGGMGS